MPDSADLVTYDVAAGVATLTLDSPHNRNALSRRLVSELFDGLDRAAQDGEVKVVLLTSSGRVFCSGADLSEATSGGAEDGPRAIVGLQRAIVAHPKPVVVAVAGPVRAGGIGVVAAADIVVAAEESDFALTEVKLGLAPAAISLTVVPRLSSRAAAYSFLTGERFDAATAAGYGLVTTVVPAGDLEAEVARVCTSLSTGAPQGLRETKALLAGPLLDRIDAGADEMAALSARLFASEEAREAMLAFLSRK